jgi:VWFA-related protein
MSTRSISRRGVLTSAASLLAFRRLLPAQQETQSSKDTTFSADVNVVNVFATVRDKQGKIVRDLTKDDFTLDEDGRVQVIKYFSQEANLPLTLGLLVDTSLSQRRVLGEERTASYRFLDQVLREDKDHAFVIHFDHEVELLQDITSSRRKLEHALSEIELSEDQRQRGQWGGRAGGGGGGGHRGGGTLLYDSILLASDELMKKQPGRKALILLTDGVDTGSKSFLSNAVESAQRANTLVYSILFEDPNGYGNMGFGGGGMGRRGGGYPRRDDRPDGKKVLERISRQTGGAFFEVSKKQPIDKVYDQIQEELRNQYSLGYTPDKSDAGAGYRHIHVAAKPAGLEVQTRDGYYAGS